MKMVSETDEVRGIEYMSKQLAEFDSFWEVLDAVAEGFGVKK